MRSSYHKYKYGNKLKDKKMNDKPEFDFDAPTDDNCERLSNKTAYGLNVIYQLMMRNNNKAALKALQDLRMDGRLFDSEKYFIES